MPKATNAIRGIEETFLFNVNSDRTTPFTLDTNGSGTGTLVMVLSSQGYNGFNPTLNPPVSVVYDNPHMPWLKDMSANYKMYRITRARLVVVGTVGSTA